MCICVCNGTICNIQLLLSSFAICHRIYYSTDLTIILYYSTFISISQHWMGSDHQIEWKNDKENE